MVRILKKWSSKISYHSPSTVISEAIKHTLYTYIYILYIYTIALTFKFVSGVLDDEKVISAVFYHWIQFVSSFSVPETRICPIVH